MNKFLLIPLLFMFANLLGAGFLFLIDKHIYAYGELIMALLWLMVVFAIKKIRAIIGE